MTIIEEPKLGVHGAGTSHLKRSHSMNDVSRQPVMHQCSENGVVSVYVNPGLEIATKVVHLEVVRPEYGDRLANEATVLRRLRHDNIVAYHSHALKQDGPLRLIMEYIPGCDLFDFVMQQGAPTLATLGHIMTQLLSALKYLHAQHVAHGDIKLENVMITEWNHVKLIDFGYAVQCDAKMSNFEHTMVAMGMGTPVYSAPEIHMGRMCCYNPLSADVYSVTVTTCVLMCGTLDVGDNGCYNPNDALDFAPTWLSTLIRKGVCSAPSKRPSMSTLLSEFVRHNGKRSTF